MNRAELERYERNLLRVERFEILFGLLRCRSLQEAVWWLVLRLFG